MNTIVDFECVQPARCVRKGVLVPHALGAWSCDVIWASGKREHTLFYPGDGADWHKAVAYLEATWLGRNPRDEAKQRIRDQIAAAKAARDPYRRLSLTVQFPDREQVLEVIYSTELHYCQIRNMFGLNDLDIQEIFEKAAKENRVAAEILEIVHGEFADMRCATLPAGARLYAD